MLLAGRLPVLLALAVGPLVCACRAGGPVAVASPPVVVAGEDVVWVTRTVEISMGDGAQPQSGLFACYRKPAAAEGPPTCYLASYVWRAKDLAWPATGEEGAPALLPPTQPRVCSDDNGCDPGARCVQTGGQGHCERAPAGR
jgi:hypothetical protein